MNKWEILKTSIEEKLEWIDKKAEKNEHEIGRMITLEMILHEMEWLEKMRRSLKAPPHHHPEEEQDHTPGLAENPYGQAREQQKY